MLSNCSVCSQTNVSYCLTDWILVSPDWLLLLMIWCHCQQSLNNSVSEDIVVCSCSCIKTHEGNSVWAQKRSWEWLTQLHRQSSTWFWSQTAVQWVLGKSFKFFQNVKEKEKNVWLISHIQPFSCRRTCFSFSSECDHSSTGHRPELACG